MKIKNLGMKVWEILALPFYLRAWKEVSDCQIQKISVPELKKLSFSQIFALGDRITKMPERLFLHLSENQQEALSNQQICSLAPQQLQCLVSSSSFSNKSAIRVLEALAKNGQHYKLGEILEVIPKHPWKHETLKILLEALKDQSVKNIKKFLTVIAKTSNSDQFSQVLNQIEKEDLIEYFKSDYSKEKSNPLASKIEERDFSTNMNLQKINKLLINLSIWRESSALDISQDLIKKLELLGEPVESSWKTLGYQLEAMLKGLTTAIEVPKKVQEKLRETTMLVFQCPEKAVGDWNQILDEWVEEIKEEKEKHRLKLLSPIHFIDYWNEEHIPFHYSESSEQNINHVFEHLKKDSKFLSKCIPQLWEKVRLDVSCGEFSVQFFNRLISHKLEEPPEIFLETDEIEEIVGLPGMLEVLDLLYLKNKIENLTTEIVEKIDKKSAA